jgi:hypothetical protein
MFSPIDLNQFAISLTLNEIPIDRVHHSQKKKFSILDVIFHFCVAELFWMFCMLILDEKSIS